MTEINAPETDSIGPMTKFVAQFPDLIEPEMDLITPETEFIAPAPEN
jgi:hypothetical protein